MMIAARSNRTDNTSEGREMGRAEGHIHEKEKGKRTGASARADSVQCGARRAEGMGA